VSGLSSAFVVVLDAGKATAVGAICAPHRASSVSEPGFWSEVARE
jgi:hypothetical protein